MAELILVIGGARSGKSDFAVDLIRRRGGDRALFLATGQAGDDEMARRIERHRRSRPSSWTTLEAPREAGARLAAAPPVPDAVLVDCLTLLVSNELLADGEEPCEAEAARRTDRAVQDLLAACRARAGTVVLVTGEVGLGLVPEHRLGRLYRDLLGRANRAAAAAADRVVLMVAGLPVDLKDLAAQARETLGL